VKPAERGVLVAATVAVAAVLRVAYAATARVQQPLRADAGEYARYAQNLLEHGVYSLGSGEPPPPDSFRSPGYPAFLAVCRWFGGDADWVDVALHTQALLGVATVAIAFFLARTFVPFAGALAAALLTALSPHLVVAGGYVLTETLTTFLFTLGLWLLVRACQGRAAAGGIGSAGLVLGLCVLCNEALLLVPLALLLPLRGAIGWRRTLAFAAATLLPFAAWTARNASQPLVRRGSERAIASISHGSYPGMVFRDPRLRGFPYREDPEQPAFGSSWQRLGDVLGERIAADPLRYASWYLLEKPVWLWGWDVVQGRDVYVYEVVDSPYERHAAAAATHTLMRSAHLPIMLLAACTALAAALRRRPAGEGRAAAPRLLGTAAIAGTIAYLPVIPDPRYLQPLRPALFVLAAAGATALVLAWRRRAGSASAAAPATAASAECGAGLPDE
jgi:hypothetical protein